MSFQSESVLLKIGYKEREREREREREGGRETEREGGRERERGREGETGVRRG